MKKVRVLFVCLGNICRSPLAEAIFKHKVKQNGLEKWIEADSCGTSNYNIGDMPDPRTIANATRNGVSIEHCGRQLCVEDFDSFDYILAMDRNNYNNILRVAATEEVKNKVTMMREFDPQGTGDVPDPYYGGEKGFQEVFDILERTMDSFVQHLVQTHGHDIKR
jgi:protein-tyrosine phosphatase